ncbi:unnamed protein product [Microthlaspi erraticum]|uniref:Exoribonuclease phosphorolytic domain-containing protein n=1 Tax=Microthlaspi erraticum TaxID=1685480 RepID=A0A6D2IJK4_9BRAS|nr:unnamed protein product [Microthlaspi erraticum]
MLHKALEGVIMMETFPKTTVDVFALVLESGGSDLPVVISCASLALADAGIMTYDLITAVSVDYAWVRRGMIFPFVDYVARFQEQSELQGCSPGDFQKALEEAFTEKLMHDIHMAVGNSTFNDSFYRWIQETAASNRDLTNNAPSQELMRYRNPLACVGCGTVISF